jgi:hypothetical protein
MPIAATDEVPHVNPHAEAFGTCQCRAAAGISWAGLMKKSAEFHIIRPTEGRDRPPNVAIQRHAPMYEK